MVVKGLQGNEILDGLHLVWEVFADEIAPIYTPQGVAEFQQFIKFENFMPRVVSGEMAVYGAVEGDELCGVGAVQNNGHVALLFVRKKWQRQGVANMLMGAMYRYCVGGFSLLRMTVNAAPNSVEAYRHMGFRDMMPEQVENGIRYIPMERMAAPGDIRPQNKAGNHKGLFIGIGVCVVILLILLALVIGKVVTSIRGENYLDREEELYEEEPYDEYGLYDDGEEEDEEGTGIEAIRCYEAENLPYTIKEESYSYRSEGNSGEYPMEFDIKYPQIEGLEGGKADEVNEMLKESAMNTVDMLYLNPSDEMKEMILQESNPILASQVIYRVTYAGEDFVSITFSDHYFAGSYYAEFQDLRTCNIRLSDAKKFETADIVELSDTFMEDWYQRMKGEAPDAAVLDGLEMEEFQQILSGEVLENRYSESFFVSADGIEIGFTYHYLSEDKNVISRGWITAPFSMDDVRKYKTESEFWELF